jgi:hypothetical protein
MVRESKKSRMQRFHINGKKYNSHTFPYLTALKSRALVNSAKEHSFLSCNRSNMLTVFAMRSKEKGPEDEVRPTKLWNEKCKEIKRES